MFEISSPYLFAVSCPRLRLDCLHKASERSGVGFPSCIPFALTTARPSFVLFDRVRTFAEATQDRTESVRKSAVIPSSATITDKLLSSKYVASVESLRPSLSTRSTTKGKQNELPTFTHYKASCRILQTFTRQERTEAQHRRSTDGGRFILQIQQPRDTCRVSRYSFWEER